MTALTLTTTRPTPPDLSAIDKADLAESTRGRYKTAITNLIEARINPLDRDALAQYSHALPASARMFLSGALKIMFRDVTQRYKANATPENIGATMATLYRLEAMGTAIPTTQPESERLPNWLTQKQVDKLLALAYRESLRDYIVLAILAGCGLRREELEYLTFDNLRAVGDEPVIILKGKGAKVRTVPVSPALYKHLQAWKLEVGPGRIARKIHKTGKIGLSLSSRGIYNIVAHYGTLIGITDLQPHDLRRTFGRLVYQATKDIIKVMHLFGHSKPQTTLHYIGMDIDTLAVDVVREVEEGYGD